MRLLLPLVGVLACGGEEPSPTPSSVEAAPTSEPAGSPSSVEVPAPTQAPVPAPEGEAPPVVLVWTGIGDLHKGFFTTSELVTRLAADLHGTVAAPANVHIRFDSRWHKGWIQLKLLPGTLRLPIGDAGAVVNLQALAPITSGLAHYRSAVAGRFDMRVDSFKVGIEAFRGAKHCVFGVAGLPPPDGRAVSPCVEINGTEHCGVPETGGMRFEASVAETIRECLG